ncbi:hypothetical protein T09_13880 [Trichinella sp. T9]|nr:hypothetical protein T09_13880 [Trichinella sp. T9]
MHCSCSYTVLCGNEFLRLIVRRMNVCGVNFSSNRNHSNLHSVEQCFQRWGATKSETGSSVLFMSVKGLLESSDSGEDGLEEIASHWRSETHQFNRIDRKLSKARAVSKLRLNALNPFFVDVRVTGTAFKHNIKQISEHEQLTTLNNVDYHEQGKDLFVLESPYFCLPCCAAKPFLSTLKPREWPPFASRPNLIRTAIYYHRNIKLMIEEMVACIQEQRLLFKIIFDVKNELDWPIGVIRLLHEMNSDRYDCRSSKYSNERRDRPSAVSVCNLEQNASQLERTQSIQNFVPFCLIEIQQITVAIHQYLHSNLNMLKRTESILRLVAGSAERHIVFRANFSPVPKAVQLISVHCSRTTSPPSADGLVDTDRHGNDKTVHRIMLDEVRILNNV